MKTLYHVTGTFRFADRYGSHAVKLDQVVTADGEDLAITTAINNTGVPFEAYLEDDEAVICDELTGERLEEYERLQAERYSQQYCESLFPSVNGLLSDEEEKTP